MARAIRCSPYTLQFPLNDERIGRPDVTGSLARLRYKHRAACAAPLKLKAEWREPSGVRWKRNGASHPVSDESGALPQKYTILKQPIGRTVGIEF